MTDHMPAITETAATMTPGCTCGWKGRRSTFGNAAGYGYAWCVACAEWMEHARKHGWTYDRRQLRHDGRLVATIITTYDLGVWWRRAKAHNPRRCRYGSESAAIVEAIQEATK